MVKWNFLPMDNKDILFSFKLKLLFNPSIIINVSLFSVSVDSIVGLAMTGTLKYSK